MKTLTEILPNLAAVLSKENFFKKKLLYVKLVFFAIITKKIKNNFPVRFSFTYNNIAIPMTLVTFSDIGVLKEIFLDKEYENFPEGDVDVIVDLGAHFGDTSLYYHACFPNAKIFAVEPSPESYERLVVHTKKIKNIIPIHAAIGGEDKEIALHLMPSSLGNSFNKREGSLASVLVPQITLTTLYKNNNISQPDIIKFDVEGAEFSIFKSEGANRFARMCIGEVHEDLGEGTIEAFKKEFSNYSQVQIMQLPKKQRYSFVAK